MQQTNTEAVDWSVQRLAMEKDEEARGARSRTGEKIIHLDMDFDEQVPSPSDFGTCF